jgi:two-component system, LytTR family, sensor kinase
MLVIPLIAGKLNHLLFGERVWNDYRVWLCSYPILLVVVFLSSFVHVSNMHWLRRKFPVIRQTKIRLFLLAITYVSIITLAYGLCFYGYDAIHFLDYQLSTHEFKVSLVFGYSIALISATMWESDYIFKKWKESLSEKESLEQLKMNQEFETLKSQVNPHFLFNCFNTLSSLISEDKKRAEVFLGHLSKAYRYLLRNNENSLSTLEIELKFMDSYFELLHTRFGDSLQYTIEVDKVYLSYLLPSLSLQLLVENAVKHNVLSRERPLVIEIFTTAGNKLIVNNNVQARKSGTSSNRIGLKNICYKYQLLDVKGFEILQQTGSFTVVLPLIWNSSANLHPEHFNIYKEYKKPL